jgi:peptidoglycan/LPS O-acetylase OafA/YrhL
VFAWLLFFILCRHIVHQQSLSALIAQTICCVLLIGAIANLQSSRLVSFLQSRPVQFLGRVSFSLYLLNVVVLFCLWSVRWLSSSPNHALEIGLLVGFVSLVITLPFAHLSEKWIEQPGIALGRIFAPVARRLV